MIRARHLGGALGGTHRPTPLSSRPPPSAYRLFADGLNGERMGTEYTA